LQLRQDHRGRCFSVVGLDWRLRACRHPLSGHHDNEENGGHTHAGAKLADLAGVHRSPASGLPPLEDNLTVVGNLIYFSFVTLTSVGYGDIVPVHPFARGLANVEAIIGQLYPATLLARLVTLELEHRRQ
jgi:hypothetical protein